MSQELVKHPRIGDNISSALLLSIGLFLSSIASTSCLMPDDYKTTIIVKNKYRYTVSFKGDIVFAPALNAIDLGEFDSQRNKEISNIEEALYDEEGFEFVEYDEKGRFYVESFVEKEKYDDYYFISKELPHVSVVFENGTMIIQGKEFEASAKSDLSNINLNLEGKLIIKTRKSVKVNSHNADTRVKNNNTTIYTWFLDIKSPNPKMILKSG